MANSENITESLAQTPLYKQGVELKARFTSFGGWQMPVQYSGITHEHQAVRNAAGMFDISHMGKFTLQGKNLISQLDTLVPSDLSRLHPGQAQYTVLLNHQAGIIDDIIIYFQGTDTTDIQKVVIIVNAATTHKDKTWILQHLDPDTVQFQDISRDQILIAVQGPKATSYLQSLVTANLSSIKAFGHLETTIFDQPAFLARTGYTGEDGFEVMVDHHLGLELWQHLNHAGVLPCGLGCRDTLRLEAAMALYGQDIDDTITPLEAGLGWLVHLDTKGDFIGRSVLEQQKAQGVQRKLIGLQTQGRNIARHGYPVLAAGEVVGEVTSGTLSPTLSYPIALAYVPTSLAKVKQQLEVEIRGKAYPATVVKRPFYRSKNRVSN
ncbi:glycine cleavage system aminomethyltransferase GcvT [Anabaena sp. UHCC 0451]|uniref:glycine cleavage system aminomethyltransferase GcvT n=1 Tax=Anabaena sp. UHCC 0451 TaxID=2055235 RepID=UPI002B1FE439|nr:glycine cleavage system aminomethyltransferase GcvT [Anabaena sp. UHCC 0451]MEA5576789.1 glycine cleavage system aminomethyltransferase GcvT [Anabaena sp. UHCC 0451]